jgi:hypothetical protein
VKLADVTELCSAEAAGETTAALSSVHAAARSSDSAKAPELRTPLSEGVVTSGTMLEVSARNRQ